MAIPTPRFRDARIDDAKSLARLYVACFPEHARSAFGIQPCASFCASVISSPAYRTLVAEQESTLVGFSILHLDRSISLGRSWIRSAIPYVILRAALAPRIIISLALKHLRSSYRRKFSRSTALPASGSLNSGYIDFLGVSPDHQGKGIAGELLKRSLRIASEKNLRVLQLTVEKANTRAITLYERHGFTCLSSNPSSPTLIYQLELKENTISC